MQRLVTLIAVLDLLIIAASPAIAQESSSASEGYDPFAIEDTAEDPDRNDPLEPFNRAMFTVNDRFYFYLLKPVAQGYAFLAPEPVRRCVKRFFANLETPIRAVNALAQGKFRQAGTETARLCINTTVGVAGLLDPALTRFDLAPARENTNQTLGHWGAGSGWYIVLPLLGPSSIRGMAGLAGDTLLNPLSWAGIKTWERIAAVATDRVNGTSLRLGDYEDLKKAALDPYSALRNAYQQNTERAIRD